MITTARIAVGLALAACALSVTVAGSAAAGDGWTHGSAQQAASVAIPAGAGTPVHDETLRQFRVRSRTVRADALATASVTCDGCVGAALTIEVVIAHDPHSVTVNNVATAWSSCQSCSANAVSLQVIIARRAGPVVAANRALGLNAGCVNCRTSATAIQIVLISPAERQPSSASLARVVALLQSALSGGGTTLSGGGTARPLARGADLAPGSAAALPAASAVAARIQSLLAADTGAVAASHSVQTHVQ